MINVWPSFMLLSNYLITVISSDVRNINFLAVFRT